MVDEGRWREGGRRCAESLVRPAAFAPSFSLLVEVAAIAVTAKERKRERRSADGLKKKMEKRGRGWGEREVTGGVVFSSHRRKYGEMVMKDMERGRPPSKGFAALKKCGRGREKREGASDGRK
ncbi:hypothetical protein HAX54_015552 [Datura stramonium]|uniref:Uncharacterized protein n=1 Tax=Datura stramonium TaxID=4076 RepID=A0ABS8TPW5_DATST|nr:hypothetical protein [Datura stramonium]